MSEGSLARYARAIERRWTRFLERPALLSPGDWRWISEWHQRGIPLEVIEDCLEEAADRRRAGRGTKRPRGLSYIAPAVEESWSAVVDGRTAPADAESSRSAPDGREAWQRRLASELDGSPLASLLGELLTRLEDGADPAQIDEALDRALPRSVGAELLRTAEADARAWLAAHHASLPPEERREALRRAATVRLRRRLQLPRLTQPSTAS